MFVVSMLLVRWATRLRLILWNPLWLLDVVCSGFLNVVGSGVFDTVVNWLSRLGAAIGTMFVMTGTAFLSVVNWLMSCMQVLMLKNTRAIVKSVLVLRPVSNRWVLSLVLLLGRGPGNVVMLMAQLLTECISCINLAVPVRFLGRGMNWLLFGGLLCRVRTRAMLRCLQVLIVVCILAVGRLVIARRLIARVVAVEWTVLIVVKAWHWSDFAVLHAIDI